MKHLFTLILLLSALTVSAQFVNTPGSGATFLDNTSNPQSRQGWLGIGSFPANSGPAATLDVRGASIVNGLKVFGNAVIGDKLSIGGTWGTTSGNGLKVSGGTLRVSALGGYNKKTLCIEPSGKISRCNNTETADKCTNIAGVQAVLPYTYYENGTGRKIVVEDPNNDGICTRTSAYTKQCSDGSDNDGDGSIDASDGNCYVPVIAGQPTVTTKPTNATTATKFIATIGRPVIKIGNNWYVYDPLKDSETDGGGNCGNGVVNTGEQCDAGMSGSTACGAPGTAKACQNLQVCGDGVVQAPEVCDDGNTTNAGTCNTNCTALTYCGDATVQTPNGNLSGGWPTAGTEMCDLGTANNNSLTSCNAGCGFTWCGDGIKQTPNGYGQTEACDNGGSNANSGTATCSTSCTPRTYCGDGAVQNPNSNGQAEACDAGMSGSPTCGAASAANACQTIIPQVCGNGVIEGTEVCDDGNTTNAGTCNANCTAKTYCGDGTPQNPNGSVDVIDRWGLPSAVEQCDDGNTNPYDTCGTYETTLTCSGTVLWGMCFGTWTPTTTTTKACRNTFCGDGMVQSPNGLGQTEQCDGTSGTSAGLVCNSSCQLTLDVKIFHIYAIYPSASSHQMYASIWFNGNSSYPGSFTITLHYNYPATGQSYTYSLPFSPTSGNGWQGQNNSGAINLSGSGSWGTPNVLWNHLYGTTLPSGSSGSVCYTSSPINVEWANLQYSPAVDFNWGPSGSPGQSYIPKCP